MTGERPNISSFTVQDERSGTEIIDLNQHSFKVAFAVEKIILDGGNQTFADDPNFVEWYASIDIDSVPATTINLHKCTKEDFADFHEIVDF
jgi:hypothetical protein